MVSGRRAHLARARTPRAATEEGTAAGIYGVIVGAGVMAASHAEDARTVVAAVLVTRVVYWAAERYARLIAQRIHDGHRLTWGQTRHALTSGWEIVSTSTLPVAVLVVVDALGHHLPTAVYAALACSTGLLCLGGWEVGRRGRLSRAERIVATVTAGLFEVAMIGLKTLLH